MLVVTNSFLVLIFNSFLLPIAEEVHEATRQRTISTCVMFYSKFEQEPSAFIQALTEWSLTRTNTMEKACWLFTKVDAVTYGSGRL